MFDSLSEKDQNNLKITKLDRFKKYVHPHLQIKFSGADDFHSRRAKHKKTLAKIKASNEYIPHISA